MRHARDTRNDALFAEVAAYLEATLEPEGDGRLFLAEATEVAPPDFLDRDSFAGSARTCPPAPMPFGAPLAAGPDLDFLLDNLDAPFSEVLLALVDQRGLRDSQVYRRANMSRQLFSKIRSTPGYHPTKRTVLALAIALELDLPQTESLLARAGYAISHASKADVIVEYFIVHGLYDINEVNRALFAFDQPILGS